MEKTLNGKNANVEWKNAEWDKTLNEKTFNGTKHRIENRKEKYI
jgi:hypothetical protein